MYENPQRSLAYFFMLPVKSNTNDETTMNQGNEHICQRQIKPVKIMSNFVQLLCHYGPHKFCMDANLDDIIQEFKCGRSDQVCDHAGAAGGFVITWFIT